MLQSRNTIAVPPGSSVREILEERQMTQKEFAIRMGLSEKHVSHLLNGKTELTQDVALRLESVLGVPAEYWNRLEAIYRERIERVVRENELDSDLEIARRFPYARMANLGWIEPTKDLKSRVLRLRSFCEVARLDLLTPCGFPGSRIAWPEPGTSMHTLSQPGARKRGSRQEKPHVRRSIFPRCGVVYPNSACWQNTTWKRSMTG
jgi:HTH-type transcriptional regulator/antitoxin HigA